MSTATAHFTLVRVRCHWRSIIMVGAAVVLLGVFWFASRYPQLLSKAEHVGQAVPSMAYSSQVMTVAADAPVDATWERTAVRPADALCWPMSWRAARQAAKSAR